MESLSTTSALTSIFIAILGIYAIVLILRYIVVAVRKNIFFQQNNSFDLTALVISALLVFKSVYTLTSVYSYHDSPSGVSDYLKIILSLSVAPVLYSLISTIVIFLVVRLINRFVTDSLELQDGYEFLKSLINGVLILVITFVLLGSLENLFLSFFNFNSTPI